MKTFFQKVTLIAGMFMVSTAGAAVGGTGNGDIGSAENLKVSINSVYTDLKSDCVVISSSTDKAPIDFYDAECKSFGGYSLRLFGSDLRYHPVISYGGKEIEIETPYTFHDTASNKVEWVYRKKSNEEGLGGIEWIGMIFRLSVATEADSTKDVQQLYAVRLDGAKTCLIGTTHSNQKARDLVYKSKPGCK